MRTIGIFLYNGFETLDVFGPVEMFRKNAVMQSLIKIIYISAEEGPIRAYQGQFMPTDYTFSSLDESLAKNEIRLDILMIPGASETDKTLYDPNVWAWIRRMNKLTELTISVCTGAAYLAKAGVLNGHRATTNKQAFQWVTSSFRYDPSEIKEPDTEPLTSTEPIQWVYNARWVDSDRVITSSGVSAGMDMAVYLIARLFDTVTDRVSETVTVNAEYTAQRDPTVDKFATEQSFFNVGREERPAIPEKKNKKDANHDEAPRKKHKEGLN